MRLNGTRNTSVALIIYTRHLSLFAVPCMLSVVELVSRAISTFDRQCSPLHEFNVSSFPPNYQFE